MIRKPFNSLILSLFIAVILLSFSSCDPSNKAEEKEEETILDYISQNPTLAFERKASGLYYYEVLTGQGEIAQTGDTAYVKYTGKLLDGTVFDTNIKTTGVDTLIRAVNEGFLIQGFDEGLTYMRQGGKALFLIPSSLGYGSSGYYFPAYTPMLFEVEMVKLEPGVAR
jgi:FKBP-type peptidyl-prolyl cis-trans isomerase